LTQASLLLLKLTLVPGLIWGISMAGRIWGPSVAGWLSAFPVVTGPILFFISVEQGAAFGAAAAASTLLAILAHLSFGLAYAWAATRWRWGVALLIGLSAYALCLLGLSGLHLKPTMAVTMVLAVLLIARQLFPKPADVGVAMQRKPVAALRHREMALRMAAGALLVLAVTWMAGSAGPRWSGLLAMFPVLGVVLAVFSHRQVGAGFVIALLRDMVWGYFAFATFCVLLAWGLRAQGMAMGFTVAVLGALAVQGATLAVFRRGSSHR
jgi:hypothetical protein